MRTREQQVERLGQLIKGIDQVMFTTISPDGTVNSRPMLVLESEFDGSLWFFTQRSSCKVESIIEDSRINLAFMDPAASRFVSMSGYAELVEDDILMKEKWSPRFQDWFSGGISDPDLALIRVHVAHAEYWDTPHAEIVESFCLDVPAHLRSVGRRSEVTAVPFLPC